MDWKSAQISGRGQVRIMTEVLSKRDELLKLLPELQCRECKDVPGPKENQMKRYQCLNMYGYFSCFV